MHVDIDGDGGCGTWGMSSKHLSSRVFTIPVLEFLSLILGALYFHLRDQVFPIIYM